MATHKQLRANLMVAYHGRANDDFERNLNLLFAMAPEFSTLTREQLEDRRQGLLVQLAAVTDALRRMNDAAGRHDPAELERWMHARPPESIDHSDD